VKVRGVEALFAAKFPGGGAADEAAQAGPPCLRRTNEESGEPMSDVLYVGMMAGAFLICAWFVRLLKRD